MTHSPLYLARAAALPGSTDDVQMFPPGRQVIVPSSPDPKKKLEPMDLVIDEATAIALEEIRAKYQADADAATGDAPYFDFNHSDGEASAWPKRIYWAGDDPLLGGVRAEVEWSSAGEEAVQGKLFRRFSPAFYAANGKVIGAPLNMGGLVNRAAFTHIQPLFAKDGSDPAADPDADASADNPSSAADAGPPIIASAAPTPTSPPEPTMTPDEIASLQAENADLKADLAELQTQLDELTANAKAAAATDAKNVVECAARDGRIPPAAAIQAKWVEAIIANPSAKELLLAMAPNPALSTVIHAKAGSQETPEFKPGLEGLAEIIAAKRAATKAN